MSSPRTRFAFRFALPALVAGLLTGCGHEPLRQAPAGANGSPERSPGEKAAIVAVRQVGVPYRYGGNTSTGFDCSGLVQFAYASTGKRIPRTTSAQWRELPPVSGHDLRVGDVLFFKIDGQISHVGLYLGSGRFVHAPASGREVSIATLDADFYRRAFVRGGRPM